MDSKVNRVRKKMTGQRMQVIVVIGLLLVAYSYFASIQVATSRINLLYKLSGSKDKCEILMTLGALYAEGGRYACAIDCYRHALNCKQGKGVTNLLAAWEDLNCAQPFNPEMHSGFGEMFEHRGDLEQAEMEFRQALKLHPKNANLEYNVTRVQQLKVSDFTKKNQEHPLWKTFRQNVAAHWFPPGHSDHLVTRCRVYPVIKGPIIVEVVGTSGYSYHDQSAVAFLKTAPVFRSIFLNGGILDCGCMSEGDEKLISCTGLGEFNFYEPSVAERLASQVGCCYNSVNEAIGILRL